MNTQQRKYAIERINTLITQKEEAIKAKYRTPGIQLRMDEMREALRTGAFDVTESDFYRGSDLYRVVKFHGDVEGSFDEKSANAEIKAMKTEAAAIKDQLMLGDAAQALEAIEKFRDFA